MSKDYQMNELWVINELKQGLWCTIWLLDTLRQIIIATFKNEVSSIKTETNLVETDFLDVTFNLSIAKYSP